MPSGTFRYSDLTPSQAAILDGYFGRGVVVKPAIVAALKGNGNAAILLSQFIYLALHHKQAYDARDGWFYNTREELEEMTGLAPDTQTTARRRLVELGVIQETKRTAGHRLNYRVNMAIVAGMLQEHAARQLALTNASQTLAESTQNASNAVLDEKPETPVSRNPEPRFLETDNPGFSISKTSTKTSLQEPSSPNGDNARPTEKETYARFMEVWNEERGKLTKARILATGSENHIKRLVKDHGFEPALEMLRAAARVVRDDPHWLGTRAPGRPKRAGRPYGIENLLRHVIDKYNLALDDQPEAPTPHEGERWTSSAGLIEILDVLPQTVIAKVVIPDQDESTRGAVISLDHTELRTVRA